MTEQGCARCRELAPELAMGLVTGRERATALAHLQECADCRGHLASLTRLHDELRTLIPHAEPPAGFETRVLARLHTRQRRWPWVVAAAAATTAVFLGGWTLAMSTAPAATSAPLTGGVRTVLAAPLVAGGQEVGQVYVYPDQPSWLYMYVDAPAATGPLICVVLRRDGSVADTAPLWLVDGDAFWGGPLPRDQTTPAGVRVTDGDGTVVASAQLPESGQG